MDPCTCPIDARCERCRTRIADAVATLSGVAKVRGERWAERAAHRCLRAQAPWSPTAKPWPGRGERNSRGVAVDELTARQVEDLSGDPDVRRELAAIAAAAAARRWKAIAAMGEGVQARSLRAARAPAQAAA